MCNKIKYVYLRDNKASNLFEIFHKISFISRGFIVYCFLSKCNRILKQLNWVSNSLQNWYINMKYKQKFDV